MVHNAKEGDVIYAKIDRLAKEQLKCKNGELKFIRDKDGNEIPKLRGWKLAKQQCARLEEKKNGGEWLKEIPLAIRDSGIRDMQKAITSTKAAQEEKKNRGEKSKDAKFTYRTRHDATQTFSFPGRVWNQRNGKIRKLFSGMKLFKEKLPESTEREVRVRMDRVGKVELIFAEVKKVLEPSSLKSYHQTVALDPGVRTFQTLYDADGYGIEWGDGDMKKIHASCRQIDRIISIIDQKKNEAKKKKGKDKRNGTWALKRAKSRKFQRLKNKVKECHRKLALFLCENYKVILIPKFEVSKMTRKKMNGRPRKINNKAARLMRTWSHYAFREYLKSKAEFFPGVKVVEVSEAWTSKTCDECGTIHRNLGSNKVFKCPSPSCHHTADRDLHAAKNILLRYLSRMHPECNGSKGPGVLAPLPFNLPTGGVVVESPVKF